MDDLNIKSENLDTDTNESTVLQCEKIEQNTESDKISKGNALVKQLKNKKGIWGVLGSILALLLKFKAIIFLVLTKLKFLLVILKLGKFASTLISMFIMIAVYARIYGWAFGIGFVILLFIHEMGHYLCAKYIKLDVTLPIFIPFVGALIRMKEAPRDAVVEAKLAMGGPILGSLGSLICFLLYFPLKQNFLMALAYTGFMLNLFNLIPLHPLDGGRTVSAISPKLWLVGIPVGIVALVKFFNPIIVLLLVLGVLQLINQWKNPDKSYYEVLPSTRFAFAIVYFGLIALLGLGMTYIHSIHVNMIIS